MADTESMIEARELCKFYGPFAAIRNVSFSIPKGQVVAFLGPNGAGKSTTMKILTGFLSPTSGSAWIGGFDVYTDRIKAANMIGYLPENGPLYPEESPQSLLKYVGEARGMSSARMAERLGYVAKACNLESVWGKPISKLSKGFRQRVGMAQALLHDPSVLILDEPTAGLDPNQVQGVRDLINESGKTKTILLSTHVLPEVEAMADRVILIGGGRIKLDGTVADLKGSSGDMEARFRELTVSGAA
jgi:ABC-2 type transport system ATP-binding protein